MKLTKRLSGHKAIFLWLAVFWTAVVTYFCLVSFNDLPGGGMKHFDKLGHISFHFGMTVLWFLYYKFQRINAQGKAIRKAVLFSFLYGVGIELAQAFFTTTRNGDVLDVCANLTGSLLAVLAITALMNSVKTNPGN